MRRVIVYVPSRKRGSAPIDAGATGASIYGTIVRANRFRRVFFKIVNSEAAHLAGTSDGPVRRPVRRNAADLAAPIEAEYCSAFTHIIAGRRHSQENSGVSRMGEFTGVV